mgnify:CR=1 FL=1
MEFRPFPKIPRLSRECVITEKIDGTNASIYIEQVISDKIIPVLDGPSGMPFRILAASRTRFITPSDDNFGFAAWVQDHELELLELGPGHHFGEWWGKGIQRGYNQIERKFSLFNTAKWSDAGVRPACCGVVPVLHTGVFDSPVIEAVLEDLKITGSKAAPGYPYPEGVVVYHTAGNHLYKKTLDADGVPKNAVPKPKTPRPYNSDTTGRRKVNVGYITEKRANAQH